MRTDASALGALLAQSTMLLARQSEIAKELGSGTRLGTLSNDPTAAADSVRLSGSIAAATSTLSAIQGTQARLQTADTALGSIVQALTSAVSSAVSGANDTLNASNRSALAQQLASLRDSVVALANSSYNGSYLFGGTANAVAPYTAQNGQVTYAGDANGSSLTVHGNALTTSVGGPALFGSGSTSVFAALQDSITTLASGSILSAAQVTALRSGLDTVIAQRSVLAQSAARLNDASAYTSAQKTNLQAEQTTVAAADPATLASELSASETQRTALLSSLAVLNKGSLFDYL